MPIADGKTDLPAPFAPIREVCGRDGPKLL
jgi:hypothetical protein